MLRHVPNLLTASRLVLAAVFFAFLSRYQYEGHGDPTLLNIAFAIYMVALATDYFDGYLARRWKAGSAFGRMTDPFVDKVLVLGSFIFFAGKNFVIPEGDVGSVPDNVKTITGIAPWMVVVLLSRELLVTTFRGMGESAGQNFGANMSGKVKMTLQSATILVVLAFVNFRHFWQRHDMETAAQITRDVFIWATLAITVYSGLTYVRKASVMFHGPPGDGAV